MTTRRNVLLGVAFGALAGAGALTAVTATGAQAGRSRRLRSTTPTRKWRHLLTAQQYAVLRTASTEAPYSSRLNDEHRS